MKNSSSRFGSLNQKLIVEDGEENYKSSHKIKKKSKKSFLQPIIYSVIMFLFGALFVKITFFSILKNGKF